MSAATANPSAGVSNSGPTVTGLRHNPGLSLEWSDEEQSILQELLLKYASETNVMKYCKIAQYLNDKTVRDVALRCRWMTKKENGKRRKYDTSKKIKEKKEKVTDVVPKVAKRSNGCPSAKSMMSMDSDDGISCQDIGGAAAQLFQQTALALEQISNNFAASKIDENVGLLSKAWTFIQSSLTDYVAKDADLMSLMPQLPELNTNLLNTILYTSGEAKIS